MALLKGKFDDLVTDLMPQFFWDNYNNKGYARELYVIYQAMEPIFNSHHKPPNGWYAVCSDRSEIASICERIHKRYWVRFHKNIYPKWVKRDVYIPHIGKTDALKESLAMGFIHKSEIAYNPNENYCVHTHIGDLWWPEVFKLHQDAIAIQVKYGLGGITGTTLPKK